MSNQYYSTNHTELVVDPFFAPCKESKTIKLSTSRIMSKGTRIGFYGKITGRALRLQKVDFWHQDHAFLRRNQFQRMIRAVYSTTSTFERETIFYYCRKFDRCYNIGISKIFYLALLQLKRLNMDDAYELYPFPLHRRHYFRIATQLKLTTSLDLSLKYLDEILSGVKMITDKQKFIEYYNWAYSKMVHTKPSSRVGVCLKLFYPSPLEYGHLMISIPKREVIRKAIGAFRQNYPGLFRSCKQKAREVRRS